MENTTVIFEMENGGEFKVELMPEYAPQTVENFIGLVEEGFYDGLIFHRVIAGFMAQGGDPTGTGMGGSDDNIVGEFRINGYSNNLSHTRGAISMARSMDPDSASSQFFIVHEDSTFLDGQYAAFGYVTEGIEVVDRVCDEARPIDQNGTIPRDRHPVMNSVTIRTEVAFSLESTLPISPQE